jgi:zinc transport system substrate-binding protein
MIWEDEPHPDTVSRLEHLGVSSLVFRPCGNRPDGNNLLSVMQDNVRAFEQAFPQTASRLHDNH